MRINTNVSALNAYGNLSKVQGQVSESMAKLSSGFRINKAADDAAGLGIANKFRAETRALTQAARNAEQANSMLQIAEGGATTISKMLERMKELATQAGSANTDDAGRTRIKAEWDQLTEEIGKIAGTTKFQGTKLLDGTFGAGSVDAEQGAVAAGNFLLGAGSGFYSVKATDAAQDGKTFTISVDSSGGVRLANNADATDFQVISALSTGKQTLNFDKFGVTIETDANFSTADVNGTFSDATAGERALNQFEVNVGAGGASGDFLVRSSGAYGTDDVVQLNAVDLTTGGTGLNISGISLAGNGGSGTVTEWQAAITRVDTAIDTVNSKLGEIGAKQNRINYALENAKTTIQNFSAAESTIRDVDMAEEMTKFSKNNILAQAGTAMLAQANQAGQGVLQLLRG